MKSALTEIVLWESNCDSVPIGSFQNRVGLHCVSFWVDLQTLRFSLVSFSYLEAYTREQL